jgi:hypothetical protein
MNPETVERWTLYRTTPTLSVDALQASAACPAPPVAVKPVGVVGELVSATVALAVFDTGPTFPAASSAVTL